MNDGEERSTHQVVDAIITYIEKTRGKINLAYVPHKGKVSHYLSVNKKYRVKKHNSGNTYQRIQVCNTCDGSGYISVNACEECNIEEVKGNDGKDK